MGGVRIERRGEIAVLRLDKAKGNAIDEPLALDLRAACRELAADEGVRGVLLASAHPKLFCPGLDLVTLSAYDRPAMERFLQVFAEAVWSLFSLPRPVVAAVSGHAVAGGCVLALTADERVLRRGAQIGLNEVRVGLPLPWSVALLLRSAVPSRSLVDVALRGRNFEGDEAVQAGLAHALADAEGFEEACLARLSELADKDARALGLTKTYLRAEALREMEAGEAAHAGEFLDCWFSEATRARIRAIVESLERRA